MSARGDGSDGRAADRSAAGRAHRAGRGAAWVGLAVAATALAAFTALSLARVQPFHGWYYHFAWYPLLLGLDCGLALRRGRYALLGDRRLAAALLLWSPPVWLLFEAANFRLANWYYVFATPDLALRWMGTLLAFATVLPAVFLGHAWAATLGLGNTWRGPRFAVRPGLLRGLVALGVGFVALAAWRPTWFFPLLWGSLTLLLEPWNFRRRPSASLLGDLAAGRYARLLRLLAGGLAAGICWELLNAAAQTRWIYTVPGLDALKLFEMPPPGYLGFPVLAIDCFVIYHALVNLGLAADGWTVAASGDAETPAVERPGAAGRPVVRGPRIAAAALAAAAFAAAVLVGIPRWTVDSTYPRIGDLPGVDSGLARQLTAAGLGRVEKLAALPPAEIARLSGLSGEASWRLAETARLTAMRGLGAVNAAALVEAGIDSRCALARAAPETVSAAVRRRRDDPHAGRPARVRVWHRAARRACRE